MTSSVDDLLKKLTYLTPSELKKVKAAYHFSEGQHAGQIRKSGAPYISHPIEVALTCANWKLDKQAIMAALLHDVMEDQHVSKEELTEHFGVSVATLVDGLSKLDKLEFQTHLEAQAENFRKMLLAMARDVRVILIKLADRLHNMRTLNVMPADTKLRIANETMEVYVPIAHRLGLNAIYHELQVLAFSHLYPLRHRILSKALVSSRCNRHEIVNTILKSVHTTLTAMDIKATVKGHEKSLVGIYTKMRNERLSFSQVLDIYSFRVVVSDLAQCYMALGALHALYKPMPGKFQDYIAIPKANGYQSLHTTLVGTHGTPVKFQIRTQAMHHIAEAGVATYWLYKKERHNNHHHFDDVQQRTHTWLQSLLNIQKQTGDSAEFLEHVKVDLFPESVYVFTPKSKIIALPKGATILDFAYSIHTDIGGKTVAAKINHAPATLHSELHNGDFVEIITSSHSTPSPHWLSFTRTGKARSAIRHYLRSVNVNESIALGKDLLARALVTLNLNPALVAIVIERLLIEYNIKSLEDLYVDLGTGKRMVPLVARHIVNFLDNHSHDPSILLQPIQSSPAKPQPMMVFGDKKIALQLSSCCQPIPGDHIVGQIERDQGLVVHIDNCSVTQHLRHQEPDRWISLIWGNVPDRRFECAIKVLLHNHQGMLTRTSAAIGAADVDIVYVNMDDDAHQSIRKIHFTIQVKNRIHLAKLMRELRSTPGVASIMRCTSKR